MFLADIQYLFLGDPGSKLKIRSLIRHNDRYEYLKKLTGFPKMDGQLIKHLLRTRYEFLVDIGFPTLYKNFSLCWSMMLSRFCAESANLMKRQLIFSKYSIEEWPSLQVSMNLNLKGIFLGSQNAGIAMVLV